MSLSFSQSGASFWPVDPLACGLLPELPPGTYTIQETPTGFKVVTIEDLETPPKMYGDVKQRAARILNTFLDRPAATGVLLLGEKGSGKTLLTKQISQVACAEMGIITLVINSPLCGESFNQLLQGISQPAIVVFDEFEKTYDSDQQQKLLTLLDGTFPSKKLFMLTSNTTYSIDRHLFNRPGRIFYFLEYEGLEREFVAEYCQDNLKNLDNMLGVQAVASFFAAFNFDMLQALVEEMNRYNETATAAMKMLNIKPEHDSGGTYEVSAWRSGKLLVGCGDDGDILNTSPLAANGWEYTLYAFDDDDYKDYKGIGIPVSKMELFRIEVSRLIDADVEKGVFTFSTPQDDTILRVERPKKEKAPSFDYHQFAGKPAPM